MSRKPHARRPDQPRDLSAGGFVDRSQPPSQSTGRAPRAKAFPTLASMPRVPRPPAWDAAARDERAARADSGAWDDPDGEAFSSTARRRAATTARPLSRYAPAPARDVPDVPDVPDVDDADSDARGRRAWDAADAWDAPATWDAAGAERDDHDTDDRRDDGDLADRAEQWDGAPTDDWADETRALAPRASDRADTALAAPSRAAAAPARRLLARARSPWSLLRVSLAVAATLMALGLSFAQVGEPSQPFMAYQAHAESRAARNIAQAVKPLTSLKVPDQYDTPAQFALYGPAACSPSSMAEVLTAWGDQRATIGRMIDDLGSYLSPSAGLLDQQGFQVAAAKEGFRADISWNLTYDQILYLTNQLGLPVIVSFRRDWGYYHYFAGGHFITVTGGDEQGLTMVDSSEYYITYLPRDVFLNLWQWRGDGTAQTIVLVPKDYQYALPAA